MLGIRSLDPEITEAYSHTHLIEELKAILCTQKRAYIQTHVEKARVYIHLVSTCRKNEYARNEVPQVEDVEVCHAARRSAIRQIASVGAARSRDQHGDDTGRHDRRGLGRHVDIKRGIVLCDTRPDVGDNLLLGGREVVVAVNGEWLGGYGCTQAELRVPERVDDAHADEVEIDDVQRTRLAVVHRHT